MQNKKRKLEEISGAPLTGRQPLTKRRHTPVFELMEHFGRAVEAAHLGVQRRVKKEKPMFELGRKKKVILRRELPLATQAFVIFLRFGSLTDDAQTYLRPTEVFKRTGVCLTTQYGIIKRWR